VPGNLKNSGVWSINEAYLERVYDLTPLIDLRASVYAETQTIVVPGSVQEGDVLVLIDRTLTTGSTPTNVVPAGFTELITVTNAARRITISQRVANSTTAGTTLTGMLGGTATLKTLLALSTNKTNPTVTFGTMQSSGLTDGDPPAVSVNASGQTAPLAVLGFFSASNLVEPNIVGANNINYAENAESIGASPNLLVSYSIYNYAPPSGSITFDMPDEGTGNLINAVFFRIS
jgi:hypothetical protein